MWQFFVWSGKKKHVMGKEEMSEPTEPDGAALTAKVPPLPVFESVELHKNSPLFASSLY
jgi:hypothetical protein